MITLFLKILYQFDILRKIKNGSYYFDTKYYRFCFRYIPIFGKSKDDIKSFFGNWHRITLIKWEIEYLNQKKQIKATKFKKKLFD